MTTQEAPCGFWEVGHAPGLLVDEIGRCDDTVRLPAHGLFGLEITADGPWTVTFR